MKYNLSISAIKKLAALLGMLLIFTTVQAQELSLTEMLVKYDKETRPAIQVVLEPETDAVKKAWEDYMKDEYKVKMKGTGLFSNKDVLSAEEVKISEVSSKKLNFYTRIVEKGANTEMSVFASLGYDLHIGKDNYPAEFAQLKKITVDFLNQYLPTYYQDRLKNNEDQFSNLTKDRDKLEKNITDNTEKIEKLTKENEQMRSELATTEEQLKTVSKDLKESKTKAEGIDGKLRSIN